MDLLRGGWRNEEVGRKGMRSGWKNRRWVGKKEGGQGIGGWVGE